MYFSSRLRVTERRHSFSASLLLDNNKAVEDKKSAVSELNQPHFNLTAPVHYYYIGAQGGAHMHKILYFNNASSIRPLSQHLIETR
jgi:hypothetical protein